MAAKEINVATERGVVLNGVRFAAEAGADTVVIAITGIHGNFYSNPFYYNIGETLSGAGIDFIYAQTNDAFPEIETVNVRTGEQTVIGSWNERFSYTAEDIEAYLGFAKREGYRHVILAGHSLGANKVMHYLAEHPKAEVDHFLLLLPANLTYMMSGVSQREKHIIKEMFDRGDGEKMLPFAFMGWVVCIAATAYDWVYGNLNNAHVEEDGDFSDASRVRHTGALLIGTYDNFTNGDPAGFLRNINEHMPTAKDNRLIFIERTGHTYQGKHQQVADEVLRLVKEWRR